jgi:hypothetical protein
MEVVDSYDDDQGLIPDLPEHVAMLCLMRVPVQAHAQLGAVSRKWRDLVESAEFYENRLREGTTGHYICLLQAPPESHSSTEETLVSQHGPVGYGVSLYNMQQQTWERLPPVPEYPDGLPLFCRFVALAGKILVIGGWNSEMETLLSVHVFHFSTRTWSKCADMPSARSFFTCGVVGKNRVLVAGGHDNGKTALKTVDAYDLENDCWESIPSMHEERDEPGSVVLDGKFFVISGYPTTAQGRFVASAEVYDPSENSWTRIESMWGMGSTISSPGQTLVVVEGKLFAFQEQQLFCYNAEKNKWELITDSGYPSDIITPMCATAVGSMLVVTGAEKNEADETSFKTLMYDTSRADCNLSAPRSSETSFSEWQMVVADRQFQGIAQISCAVEV